MGATTLAPNESLVPRHCPPAPTRRLGPYAPRTPVEGPHIGQEMARVSAVENDDIQGRIKDHSTVLPGRRNAVGLQLLPRAAIPFPHVIGVELHLGRKRRRWHGWNAVV